MRGNSRIESMNTELFDLSGQVMWNEIVRSAGGHIFQTFHWANVAEKGGMKPVPIMIDNKAVLMTYVSPFFSARSLGLVWNALTIPRGPVFKDGLFNRQIFLQFLKTIDFHAVQNRAVVCNFFPNRPFEDTETHGNLMNAGFKPVFEAGSFHTQTFVLDCRNSLEELLRAMEKRTRWAIRKAERSGVQIEEKSDYLGMDQIYGLYEKTVPAPLSKEFFKTVIDALASKGLARIFFAKVGTSVVSTAFLLMFGDTMFYVWGGSEKLANRSCPGESLHWKIIQWGKEHGYRFYDFHGALVADAQLYRAEDKTASVSLFKRGFGGTFVRYLAEYRKVYSRIRYKTASTMRRLA